jgi:hypothetical protein
VHTNKHIESAFKAGELVGKKLSNLGYRGIFELDLVVSKSNKLYAVESNLRRNGGTHIHEFCKTILGKNYPNNYWVHSQDLTLKPLKLTSKISKKEGNSKNAASNKHTTERTAKNLYEHLNEYLYNPKTKTGLIIVNPDLIQCGILPILFIEKDKKSLEKLIKDIKQKLENF